MRQIVRHADGGHAPPVGAVGCDEERGTAARARRELSEHRLDGESAAAEAHQQMAGARGCPADEGWTDSYLEKMLIFELFLFWRYLQG